MRRLVYGLALLGLFSVLPGCRTCVDCDPGGDPGRAQLSALQDPYRSSKVPTPRGGVASRNRQPGPHYRPPNEPTGPAPQYAYPYYTIRGPRDFLVDNPPSIGPY